MAIYDPVVDLFTQDKVNAPQINPNAADLGGHNMQGDWAKRTEEDLWQQGHDANAERQAAAQGLAAQGQAAVQQGNQRAAASDATGAAGLAGGATRADTIGGIGAGMQANQQANATGLQGLAAGVQQRQAPQVDLGAARASAATGTQAQAGLMSNAGALGAAAGANQAQGQVAGALGSNAGALGANAASLAGMAKTPTGQTANIGALGNAAQTTAGQNANAAALGAAGTTNAEQQGNAAALRGFYQQGPGASQAEAQLMQGQQRAMASNLALARSGRGGANAGAERQALFANAAQQQDTNQSMALLRAKEADDFRNRQLQAMGLETGALGTARGQDIQGLSAQTNALGQARGQDIQALGLQGQMLGQARGQDIGAMTAATGALGAQTGALAQQGNVVGQSRGQDLQALGLQTGALGQAGSLANQQQQIGATTALGVSGQQLQQGAQNDQTMLGLQNIAAQRQAAGDQTALGALGLGNQAIGQGQQFAVGMGGLANQSVATGQGTNVAMGGLSNQAAGQGYQTDMGYQGMGLQTVTNQANLNMQLEALRTGQGLQANMANAGYDQARDSGMLGMGMGIAGLAALSDVRAKEDIGPPGYNDGGVAPYSAIVEQNKGYQAQLAATQAGQNAQKGAAAQAAAPAASSGPTAGQMAALGMAQDALSQPAPQIPQYQIPQFAPVDSNYVTSDEAAKEAAEASGFDRGQATARINITQGLGEYEARGALPKYLQYLRSQAMEDMRKHGNRDAPGTRVEVGPAEDVKPAKPAKKSGPTSGQRVRESAALGIPQGETDLRAASNSSWQYKDPTMPGAVPGRQVGPMAQDLLKTDAAPLVRQQPNGMLGVDGARAGMVALGAQGEQQRRIDELERRMAALGVRSAA